MEGESKKWQPANYPKPEIQLAEPKGCAPLRQRTAVEPYFNVEEFSVYVALLLFYWLSEIHELVGGSETKENSSVGREFRMVEIRLDVAITDTTNVKMTLNSDDGDGCDNIHENGNSCNDPADYNSNGAGVGAYAGPWCWCICQTWR